MMKTKSRLRKPVAQIERLMRQLERDVRLFRTPDGEAMARVQGTANREVFPVDSQPFRDWLECELGTASPGTSESIIRKLAARARRDGPCREVWLRTAERKADYYIDLGDGAGRVVKIKPGITRVLEQAPVLFRRSKTARALPLPAENHGAGALNRLRELLNVEEDAWLLIVAWLIEALRPDTPYVGLQIVGPQGSAKSTLQSMLRSLIDPSAENLRVKPRSREDMMVAAQSNLVVSYENLSDLSDPYQDALCSMLTGGGFAARKHFTNAEELLVSVKRPVMLNGIDRVVTRADLLDRFVTIERPEIAPSQRRSSADIEATFEQLRPAAFGAVLAVFSGALSLLPDIKAEKRPWPRMADFAQLGEAVARTLGRRPGAFLKVYKKNLGQGAEDTIGSTPFGAAIVAGLRTQPEFSGTFTGVEAELKVFADRDGFAGGDRWPTTGKAFGDQLRRLAPSLRRMGIDVEFGGRTKNGYTCRISAGQASEKSRRWLR